jgi:hypothetical protein
MCKELLVIPVIKVEDKKRIIRKRRAKEEGHKGLLQCMYMPLEELRNQTC